jgi:hypothetical protein
MASGAVISWTRVPASGGPTTSARDSLATNLLLASIKRSRPTRTGTKADAAILKIAEKVPARSATTYRYSRRRTPASAAAGMEPSSPARTTSQTIISGRRRSRSTHAPATRPTATSGAACAAVKSPIWVGVAPSTSTATSGRANCVTADPISEMLWPAQTLAKSGSRQRPASRTWRLCLPRRSGCQVAVHV